MQLPNTNLLIRFGLLHISTPYRNEPDGYGVPVTKVVKPTLADRLAGEDTELKWILEEIRSVKGQ